MKKIIILVTSFAVICGTFSMVEAKNNYSVKRIDGENRYNTSVNQLSEDILKGSTSELDVIKSKSDYTFNIKDNKGVKFSVYIYSYDKEVVKLKEFGGSINWAQNWAGASEGDTLSKGHYKIALLKEGETEPEIFDFNNNEETILNLNGKHIKAIKSTDADTPDFLAMFMPVANDIIDVKAYYIKDGKLNTAKFKKGQQITETTDTFSLVNPFLNLGKDNTIETSNFKMGKDYGYYIFSWKFNLDSGCFEYIGNRFMNKDEYSNYSESIK